MTDDKFTKFKREVLDKISPTICAAKWLDSTIWLYSGLTTSCHHPPSHKIDLAALESNPSAIHNTREKKLARLEMQQGRRPSECEYCWKIEDLSANHMSDRVFQSVNYDVETLYQLKEIDFEENVNLKTLEVAFDRTCNFACSYCNPSFSSRWARDIYENGPYTGLITDKRDHYTHSHAASDPYGSQETNPFVESFWKWWPELKTSLRQLRVTGGEPLMSPNFWKLLDFFKADGQLDINLAVNSNLGAKDELIERLVKESHHVRHLEIYTSNEAFGKEAEYIRDGLDFEKWKSNVEKLLIDGNVKRLHVMMTVNGLCLFSMDKLLDQALNWKIKFGKLNATLSFNLVRWPTFQSPLALPMRLRVEAAGRLKTWSEKNQKNELLIDYELQQLKRIIDYLERANEATENSAAQSELEKDLKRYLIQYDKRRNKNYNKTFEPLVTDWLNEIKD